MIEVLLAKESLLLSLITGFYKRIKSGETLVAQGKRYLELITDMIYETTVLTRRLDKASHP